MTTPTMTMPQWLMLAFLSLLWGGSFFFNAVLVQALPPLTLVWLRLFLALPLLLLMLKLKGLSLPSGWAMWQKLLLMGLLNNALPFCLIVWGQTHISSGLASILNATTPLFAVILAHFLSEKERLGPRRALGVLAGFAGVVVIMGPSVLSEGGSLLNKLAVLVAASSYALAGIYARGVINNTGVHPLVMATGQVGMASLLLLPLVVWLDQPWQLASPSASQWLALSALAVLSTALAYVLYFQLLGVIGASNLMLVTFLVPVSSILLGTVFLAEYLSINQLAGMGLILLGLLILDGRAFRRFALFASRG